MTTNTTTSVQLEFTSVGCNRIANCIDYLQYPLLLEPRDGGTDKVNDISSATQKAVVEEGGWVIFGANNGVGLVRVKEPIIDDKKNPDNVSKISGANHAAPNVRILKKHKSRVNAVSWIYDAQDQPCGILSGDMDGTAVIFTPFNKNGIPPSPETWEGCEWEATTEIPAHTGSIVAVCAPKPSYSMRHSDNVFVTCGIDGSTRVWVWAQEKVSMVQSITHKASYAMSATIAYLPAEDSKLIFAIGNTDRKVRLFTETSDIHEFELSATLEGHEDWLRSVALSSANEGSLMLASAGQDRSIRLWKLERLSDEKKAEGLADVMARMGLGTRAHVFQAGQNRWSAMLDALLVGHDDWVYSVSWHPPQVRGKQPACLVSASADKSLMVWSPDQDTGIWVNESQLGEIGGSTLGFYGGAFSPSGKALLALGYKGALHLWHADAPGAWAAQPFSSGHIGPVTSLSWDPSAAYLVTTSHDQTARAFAPCLTWAWREVGRPQIHGYDLRQAAFIKPHQYVCAAEEKVLRIMDAPQPFLDRLHTLTGFVAPIDANRHQGANLPALGLSNKAVAVPEHQTSSFMPPYEEELLQTTLWPELDKLYGHGYEVVSVAATPDASIIASSAKATAPEHAGIHLFETTGFKSVGVLESHQLTVTCLAFSPSSKLLVSGSRDRSWSLFSKHDASFKLALQVPKAHARIIWDIKFANDSQHILTGSRDKTVKVWKLVGTSAEVVATLQFPAPVTALAVAPAVGQDDTTCHFAVGLEDGSIGYGLGSRTSWELLYWFPTNITPSLQINTLAFQPSVIQSDSMCSFRLAAASDDHSARIYNITVPNIEA